MHFTIPTAEQCLQIAKELTGKVRNCWAATNDQSGGANARIVQPFSSCVDKDGWTIRFLTHVHSRKAAEIESSGRIALGYQYDPEQACVTLIGAARILTSRSCLRDHWRIQWNLFFPKGADDDNAVFVEVAVERVEIYNMARGIASPPHGNRAVTLLRTSSSGWQVE